jgi:hypothetical protein
MYVLHLSYCHTTRPYVNFILLHVMTMCENFHVNNFDVRFLIVFVLFQARSV